MKYINASVNNINAMLTKEYMKMMLIMRFENCINRCNQVRHRIFEHCQRFDKMPTQLLIYYLRVIYL